MVRAVKSKKTEAVPEKKGRSSRAKSPGLETKPRAKSKSEPKNEAELQTPTPEVAAKVAVARGTRRRSKTAEPAPSVEKAQDAAPKTRRAARGRASAAEGPLKEAKQEPSRGSRTAKRTEGSKGPKGGEPPEASKTSKATKVSKEARGTRTSKDTEPPKLGRKRPLKSKVQPVEPPPEPTTPPEAEAPAALPELPETKETELEQTKEQEKAPDEPAVAAEPAAPATSPSPRVEEAVESPAQEPSIPASNNEVFPHPKPKHTYSHLAAQTLADLRKIGREFNVSGPTTLRKDDLIFSILRAQAESMNYRFGGGTLEILPEGFGFLRPKGMLPTDNDIYLSAAQIRRFGLRNGDVIWGFIRPPRDQEHYEALLRVEMVNFSDPEHSRSRPQFSHLTPIFPDKRINLDSGPSDWATRLVDMFAPIGLGQRALIVSPPKAGKTTLLKRIAKAITQNAPDAILMALLIDERPEEVTDISRSIDGEVIASTFDRPADEHIRVANLALEKAKRLVEARRDVVILLDSITRLARASNLTVPPSGRTLSGGLDPSGLYFPKRFFGAARNFEEGGSLTIIGTALTETGSRMDDVIYEEFKGTGNMELHLSRKLAEQRIFPAIDITRSGTRREELLIQEEELTRLWILRKRIAGVDEAGALNLILDKLKQTKDNHEFLMSIKLA